MPPISGRTPFPVKSPYRPFKRTSSKYIFLALEGIVTEEEYFRIVQDVFGEVRNNIRFISVVEDIIDTPARKRTSEQVTILSKSKPYQLVDKITEFKSENNALYEFSKHADEFWIVTDVDNNWEPEQIGKWDEAISKCEKEQYNYAISNPQFEAWLLLHYDDPTEEDKAYTVNDTHRYESTSHFRERLRALNVPLKDGKRPRRENFNASNIQDAVRRAKELHVDKTDLCPQYYCTTVYLLIEKILELLPEQPQTGGDPNAAPEEERESRR